MDKPYILQMFTAQYGWKEGREWDFRRSLNECCCLQKLQNSKCKNSTRGSKKTTFDNTKVIEMKTK